MMQAPTSTAPKAFDLTSLESALDEALLPYSLLQLPVDVIHLLIRSLDGRSILSLSNSCRRFRQIVKGDPKLLNLIARKLMLPVHENDSPKKVQYLLRFFNAVENLERYFFRVKSVNPPSVLIHLADYQEVRAKMKERAIELEGLYTPCPLFEELKQPMLSIAVEQRIAARALAVLPQRTYITLEQLKENSLYTLYKGDDAQIGCIQHTRGDQSITSIAQTMRECLVIRVHKRRSPDPAARL